MDITSAEFVRGINGTDKILYNGKRQIAFVGRSNVGKSSLINSLTKRRNLARSSSQPGKTIRLDFFLINNTFYFVDLPGYGFAHMSGEKHEDIRKMMLWYIEYSEVANRMFVLIVDANIGITPFDEEMMQLFQKGKYSYIVVANKIDKVKKPQTIRTIEDISRKCHDARVIPYSAKTDVGRREVLRAILT